MRLRAPELRVHIRRKRHLRGSGTRTCASGIESFIGDCEAADVRYLFKARRSKGVLGEFRTLFAEPGAWLGSLARAHGVREASRRGDAEEEEAPPAEKVHAAGYPRSGARGGVGRGPFRRLRVARARHRPRHGRAGRPSSLPRARRLRERLHALRRDGSHREACVARIMCHARQGVVTIYTAASGRARKYGLGRRPFRFAEPEEPRGNASSTRQLKLAGRYPLDFNCDF